MGVIYKITSPSGKIYVGKTYDLRKRINSHKHCARKGSNVILHNSILKYGWDTHALEIIEEVEDALLDEREMYWIAELKTYCYKNPNGLNMTLGGDGQRSTWMHDHKKREWYSNLFKGEGNPFYGKRHTPEAKQIISDKAKIRNKITGKTIPKWGAEKGRNKVMRPVGCYYSDGNLHSEYISITDAANKLNIGMGSVKDSLIYGSWVNGMYKFLYKNGTLPPTIEIGVINKKTEKRRIVLLNEDLEEIMEFSCAEVASNFLSIPKTTINRAAMYNWLKPIRTGHVFIYKDLYDEILKAAS